MRAFVYVPAIVKTLQSILHFSYQISVQQALRNSVLEAHLRLLLSSDLDVLFAVSGKGPCRAHLYVCDAGLSQVPFICIAAAQERSTSQLQE